MHKFTEHVTDLHNIARKVEIEFGNVNGALSQTLRKCADRLDEIGKGEINEQRIVMILCLHFFAKRSEIRPSPSLGLEDLFVL